MSNYYNRQWRLPNNENKDKQSNYSMDFDGNNQYIDLGNSTQVQPIKEMSISAWINASSLATYRGIVSCTYNGPSYDGFGLRLDETSSNKIQFVVNSTTQITSTSTITTGQWYHLVATYDGANIKLYFNGSLESSTSLTGNIDYSDGSRNTIIGSLYPNLLEFTGQIDGVAIFDYALSSSQVTTLYGSSSTGIGNPMTLNPKPVAYYPLGDQDVFNGSNYLVPNSSLKDYVFSFDGLNDYISASGANLPTGNSSFTASCWFRRNGTQANYAAILSWGASSTREKVIILFAPDGAGLRFGFYGDDLDIHQSYATSDNIWYNVVLTYNGSVANMYVNGTLRASKTLGGALNISSSNPILIGKQSTNEFKGSISNVQIFNTVLPTTGSNSIETLYNNGSPLTSMSGYSSLVGWYKLDASELYSDSWSVENNASPTTFKSALDFDGNDYIDCGNDSSLQIFTGSHSISAWIYFSSAPSVTDDVYCGYGLVSQIALTSSKTIRYYNLGLTTGTDMYSSTALNSGSWNHIVCTYEVNGNKNIYINGVAETPTSTSGSITSTSVGFMIGARNNVTPPDRNFAGSISNVAIYNTALSASNITTLYNNGVPQATIYGSPVSHWKLDNTTTGIQDSAGSNNGTNNGATEVATYVNTTAGISSGMNQSALQQSDLSFKTSISPFALSFDGANDSIEIDSIGSTISTMTQISISAWIKTSSSSFGYILFAGRGGSGRTGYIGLGIRNSPTGVVYAVVGGQPTVSGFSELTTTATVNDDNWHHLVMTFNNSNGVIQVYIDGFLDPTSSSTSGLIPTNIIYADIAQRAYNNDFNFDGSISNVSVWNAALTPTQVSEIYSEGVPQNLLNHSAVSSLVSWWQLGSNSSFNTNWTVLDEKGSNDGTSSNMTENDIVDGVGSYANGISSGMSDAILGDAPYSSANALSISMDISSRTSDTPA